MRNHSPPGSAWGYGGSSSAQLALVILLAVTDQATAERFYQRFKWSVIAPISADRWALDAGDVLGWLVGGGGDGRRRAPGGGGELSARRLLGAHLPVPDCLTQFAIDVRLHLPATCPDCGFRPICVPAGSATR